MEGSNSDNVAGLLLLRNLYFGEWERVSEQVDKINHVLYQSGRKIKFMFREDSQTEIGMTGRRQLFTHPGRSVPVRNDFWNKGPAGGKLLLR